MATAENQTVFQKIHIWCLLILIWHTSEHYGPVLFQAMVNLKHLGFMNSTCTWRVSSSDMWFYSPAHSWDKHTALPFRAKLTADPDLPFEVFPRTFFFHISCQNLLDQNLSRIWGCIPTASPLSSTKAFSWPTSSPILDCSSSSSCSLGSKQASTRLFPSVVFTHSVTWACTVSCCSRNAATIVDRTFQPLSL